MLMPAVALGGVESAVWVSYGSAILLVVICALLAARLGGSIGGLLAIIFVLFPNVMPLHTQIVMSDLPSATLIVLELAILVFGRGYTAWVVAGTLGGSLVWIRPANAILLLAGVCAAGVIPDWRRRLVAYFGGFIPFLIALAWWQLWMFGSPFTTGYQAAGASPNGGHGLYSFFSLHYLFGAPYSGSNQNGLISRYLPNIVAYVPALLGAKGYLVLPGVGILGSLALIVLARQRGRNGIAGRFGLVVVLGTLALYSFYFWQDPRFMLAPAALLDIAAATLMAQAIRHVMQRVGARSRSFPDFLLFSSTRQ